MATLSSQIGFDNTLNQQAGGAAGKLRKANDPTLDFYSSPTGDPTKSPLYSAFLGQAKENISNTYDQALSNTRESAAQRGFGFTSPASETAEEGVRASEAGALSSAPRTALLDTIQPSLQAAGIRANEAGTLTDAATRYNSNANPLLVQQSQAKQQLFSSLASLAGTVLGGPLGADLGKVLFPSTPSNGAPVGGG